MGHRDKDQVHDVILLVEEDPNHAELVQRMFDMNNVPNPIHHLSDGESVLEYLFRQNAYVDPATSPRPCLMLLDLRLPKMDGLDVLKRVKESKELQHLPVIIFSSSGAKEDMDKAYACGANGYLMKPVESTEFRQVIQQIGQFWLKWNRTPLW